MCIGGLFHLNLDAPFGSHNPNAWSEQRCLERQKSEAYKVALDHSFVPGFPRRTTPDILLRMCPGCKCTLPHHDTLQSSFAQFQTLVIIRYWLKDHDWLEED
jgi:hypothetical protein